MSPIEKHARECMAKHGLNPLDNPMGDDHHTDASFTKEDKEIGELAYWLGGLFIDKESVIDPNTPYSETYYYNGMTSVDVWSRVARALRIHGLKIVSMK